MSAIVQLPVVQKFPVQFPYSCSGCSAVENSHRRYFVDLGFNEFEYGQGAGKIYLCDICLENFVKSLQVIIDEKNLTLGDMRFPNGISRTDKVPDEPEHAVDGSSSGIDESVELKEPVFELSPIYPTRD